MANPYFMDFAEASASPMRQLSALETELSNQETAAANRAAMPVELGLRQAQTRQINEALDLSAASREAMAGFAPQPNERQSTTMRRMAFEMASLDPKASMRLMEDASQAELREAQMEVQAARVTRMEGQARNDLRRNFDAFFGNVKTPEDLERAKAFYRNRPEVRDDEAELMALDRLDFPTFQTMQLAGEQQRRAEAAALAQEREERLRRESEARAAAAAANAAVRAAREARAASDVTTVKKDAGPLGGAAATTQENKDAARYLVGLGAYGDLPKAEMSSLASAIANEAKAIMRTNEGVQAPQAYAMAHEKLKKSGAITEIATYYGLGKRQAFRPLGPNVTPPVTARAIASQAEYDKLAPGTTYTWKGKTYTKGQR